MNIFIDIIDEMDKKAGEIISKFERGEITFKQAMLKLDWLGRKVKNSAEKAAKVFIKSSRKA